MAATTHTLIADLALLTAMAAATGLVARLLKQPLVVGYLVAGLLVGPYLYIPILADADRVHELAELGVILVMFAVGLEFRVAKLFEILPKSGFTGLIQVGTLLWSGVAIGQLLGWSTEASIFLGASVAVSSTMVVTGVFADQDVPPEVRTHVLGILVFQDVAAIVLIAATTALAAGQALEASQLLLTLAQLGVVLAGLLVAGILLVPPFIRRVVHNTGPATLAVAAMGLAFGFATVAEHLGYSVALGAFVAGIVVAESGKAHDVEHVIAPIRDVFAAIFFVAVGMVVDPWVALQHLPTSLLVAAVIIVAQFLSIGFAGMLSGVPFTRAFSAGLALGQIGEFSFIIATIGITAGVAPESLQPILVTVAAITAFTTPKMIAHSERIVGGLSRRIPHPLQRTLSLVEHWIDRLQSTVRRDHPMMKPLRTVAIDAVILIGLFAVTASTHARIRVWLTDQFGWEPWVSTVLVAAAVVAVAAPFAFGLLRNLAGLANSIADTVLPESTRGTAAGRAARSLIGTGIYLAAFVGFGIPGMAVLRPLIVAGLAEVVMLVGVALGAMLLWRRAREADGELKAGAMDIAQVLARHNQRGAIRAASPSVEAHGPDEAEAEEHSYGGVANVVELSIDPGPMAGYSLAELDLNTRTGATVVTLVKASNEVVVMPTGAARLEVGDTVALLGSAESIDAARAVLAGHELVEGPTPQPGAA